MELLNFIFNGAKHFFGTILLLILLTRFIYKIINRCLKHYTIKKHGYPPEHCDSEGDFKFKRMEHHMNKLNNIHQINNQ